MLWPPDVKSQLIRKDPDAGKDWRQEEKGTTEDEMVGWHHWLSRHEFEQALGDGEGQGSLVCCSPWGRKEWDMTKQLNTTATQIKRFLAEHVWIEWELTRWKVCMCFWACLCICAHMYMCMEGASVFIAHTHESMGMYTYLCMCVLWGYLCMCSHVCTCVLVHAYAVHRTAWVEGVLPEVERGLIYVSESWNPEPEPDWERTSGRAWRQAEPVHSAWPVMLRLWVFSLRAPHDCWSDLGSGVTEMRFTFQEMSLWLDHPVDESQVDLWSWLPIRTSDQNL